MARYAVLCTIDETRLNVFTALRAEHYRYLIDHRESIVLGGPMRISDGARPETMIIILELETLAMAERFITEEPYSRHGGFSHIVVRPWSQVIPELQAGALEATYRQELAKRSISS